MPSDNLSQPSGSPSPSEAELASPPRIQRLDKSTERRKLRYSSGKSSRGYPRLIGSNRAQFMRELAAAQAREGKIILSTATYLSMISENKIFAYYLKKSLADSPSVLRKIFPPTAAVQELIETVKKMTHRK